MRLPIVKAGVEFIQSNDSDFVEETIEVLEHISGASGLKDEELDTIGELISNLCGSVEVAKMMREGKSQKDALNDFMKRVLGSIDR